ISEKGVLSTTFADLEIRMKLKDGRYISITGEVHIIPELACNLLIANDILHSYAGVLDLGNQCIQLGPAHLPVPIKVMKATDPTPIPRLPGPLITRKPPK